MSGVYPTKCRKPGFQGFVIERDQKSSNPQTTNRIQLPIIKSTDPPLGQWPGICGGIAYDIDTSRPYYSNGCRWFPIGTGVPGTVESYSFIKDGVQIIPTSVETIISMWDISTSSVYHTLEGWDLSSGIYTAFRTEVLTLEVNIAWAGGVSNLGDRTLRIQHMKLGVPVWNTIKEVSTQADPNVGVEKTQECHIHARISQGDALRVVAEHNAPIPIPIATGIHTSISGFRVEI